MTCDECGWEIPWSSQQAEVWASVVMSWAGARPLCEWCRELSKVRLDLAVDRLGRHGRRA